MMYIVFMLFATHVWYAGWCNQMSFMLLFTVASMVSASTIHGEPHTISMAVTTCIHKA